MSSVHTYRILHQLSVGITFYETLVGIVI